MPCDGITSLDLAPSGPRAGKGTAITSVPFPIVVEGKSEPLA